MKIHNLFILIGLLAGSVQAQENLLSWIDTDAAMKASALKSRWAHQLTSPAVPSGMDVKFHRLLLQVDPAVRFVTGSVSTYFVPKPAGTRQIVFDLHDSLKINAIKYHGAVLTTYTHNSNKVTITLPTQPGALPLLPKEGAGGGLHAPSEPRSSGVIPAKAGTAPLPRAAEAGVPPDSIMIDYQGVPPSNGTGSFSLSKHGPDSVPALYTLSEPYGAMDWWPCSQDLNDKVDSVHLVVTVPEGYMAVSNGVMVSESLCSCGNIYQWKHKHPVAAYLVGLAVTNYSVFSDWVPVPGGEPVELRNYVYPEDSAALLGQLPMIKYPFEMFNELFGLYPFADEGYGQTQWGWGGGMEHQTNSFMGEYGYDLMAHELGHQWFGDYVTCGSWRDIWLNEGFATYLTGLCYERDQGGIYWEPYKRLSINRVLREPGGSVYCPDTTSVDRLFDARLSYSKGGLVLHMLRWEMGDTAFFRMVRNWLGDPENANGYAVTEDLLRHADAASDSSYREFFNDWVYGSGYPTYSLIYRTGPGTQLELELGQVQSDASVGFFEMDVPVVVYGTASLTYVLKHTYSGQRFVIDPGFAVDSVKIDPGRWICTANAVVLKVDDVPLEEAVKVYPNPVRGQLVIDAGMAAADLAVGIYNAGGQLVWKGRIAAGTGRLEVATDGWARGAYTVKIEGKGVYKVVKE